MTEAELIPLEMLSPGEEAIIAELVGLPDDVSRLQELGLRTGESVEMLQAGSPCIIRLGGHKLCLRDGSAFSILVQPRGAS